MPVHGPAHHKSDPAFKGGTEHKHGVSSKHDFGHRVSSCFIYGVLFSVLPVLMQLSRLAARFHSPAL